MFTTDTASVRPNQQPISSEACPARRETSLPASILFGLYGPNTPLGLPPKHHSLHNKNAFCLQPKPSLYGVESLQIEIQLCTLGRTSLDQIGLGLFPSDNNGPGDKCRRRRPNTHFHISTTRAQDDVGHSSGTETLSTKHLNKSAPRAAINRERLGGPLNGHVSCLKCINTSHPKRAR